MPSDCFRSRRQLEAARIRFERVDNNAPSLRRHYPAFVLTMDHFICTVTVAPQPAHDKQIGNRLVRITRDILKQPPVTFEERAYACGIVNGGIKGDAAVTLLIVTIVRHCEAPWHERLASPHWPYFDPSQSQMSIASGHMEQRFN